MLNQDPVNQVVKKILESLNNRVLNLSELRDQLAEKGAKHIGELPSQVGVAELIDIAHDKNWLVEESSGCLRVSITNTPPKVVLVSDSQLALGYASGKYRCKAEHLKPLAAELRGLFVELNAEARWVKGHNGDRFNERCDELAGTARKSKAGNNV